MNARVAEQNTSFSSFSISEISNYISSSGSCFAKMTDKVVAGGPKSDNFVLDVGFLASLKTRKSRKVTFSGKLSIPNGLSSCTIDLYGSSSRAILEKDPLNENNPQLFLLARLPNTNQSLSSSLSFTAKAKTRKQSRKQASVFFRAESTLCREYVWEK